jgi:MFS family permease
MLLVPVLLVRLAVKKMLANGMLAWAVRYGLFAYGASSQQTLMIIAGVALHGICYDFFFVTGQMYTDKKAPPAIRAQAQGLLVMLTLGIGMLIGAQVAGVIETYCTPAGSTDLTEIDWKTLWGIPAIFAVGVLAFFVVAFKDDAPDADDPAAEEAESEPTYEAASEPAS